MKRLHYFLLTLIGIPLLLGVAHAANFTTQVSQAGGANWNGTIWQPGGVAPTAGNTYELVANGTAWGNNTGNTRVRNPATAGVQTFVGDSLTLNTNTDIRMKQAGAILDFPGVGGNPGLILNGGILNPGDNAVFQVTGRILVSAPSILAPGDNGGGAVSPTRAIIIAGVLSGSGSLKIVQGGTTTPQEVTSTDNPFTGDWLIHAGWLRGTASGSLGSGNIFVTPTNSAVAPSLFEVNYDINTPGSLTISGGGQMNLHQNCSFTGVTIEGMSLSLGLHSYAELSANFPTSFVGGGSGSITVLAPMPPPAPTNVMIVNGNTQVALSWAASVRATSYNVKRSSMNGGPYTTVGSPTGTNFVDTGLANGAIYYYVITGVNPGGESADSTQVTGTPNVPVTGLTATGGTGQVGLMWDSLGGAIGYIVRRATNSGGAYATIATGVAGTSYTDMMVQSGRTYFYVVIADFGGGLESGVSNEASAPTAPGVPVPSTSLFAATVIRVAWTADPAVAQFMLEQSLDGTTFAPLATLAGNQRSYTNAGLALDTTYFYRVLAMNAGGSSAFSVTVSNRTPTIGWNVNFANGANSSQNANPAPAPPGYVVDVGELYGDRLNTYFYGWSTPGGTNITRDARWRQNAASPDLRYDTFNHLMKANLAVPSAGATWEIEIPNGFYQVHIVAGDATAVDGVFQFDVEGVITGTYAPVVGAWWGDFVTTVGVSDGRLTVTSGPSANNNKIDFIDIYPFVPLPIVIGQHPQPLMLKQNRKATFTVTIASGSPQFSYQWYHDVAAIMDATNASLVIPHVQSGDIGEYRVVITNYAGAVTSNPAMLSVMPDTEGPKIVSVGSLDGIYVGVCFDEEIDPTSGGDSANYSITDGNNSFPVDPVVFRDDNHTVILRLGIQTSGPFIITASDVRDLAGNANNSSGTNVVLDLTPADIGSPALAGSAFTCDGTKIEIVGGGADVWGAADQFQFVSRSVTGDFDASVQVSSLRGAEPITKAVLVARETADPGSPSIHLSVNPPPPGRDLGECGVRTTQGGATVGLGATYTPVGVPNAYLRLTRVGNTFTGYRSSNGVDWIQFAQGNQASPAALLVGIGVTAHNANNSLLATGVFCNFKISQCNGSFVPVLTNYVDNGNGTFSFQFSTSSGCTYQVQCTDDVTAAIWPILETRPGTGAALTVTVPVVGNSQRFYRVRLQP